MTTKNDIEEYNADQLEKPEYPFVIWRRPSMYIGGRGEQKSIATREITDNSTHEAVRGFATKMKVVFGKDGSVIVQDNGRGLPTDINHKTGINGIILTMATLHAGANFNSHIAAGKAGAGLNGVGAAAANAMSSRFSVKVYRNNKIYSLDFKDGFPGHFDKENSPEDNFKKTDQITVVSDKRNAKEKKEYPTGTWIKFWFNSKRFAKDEKINIDDLVDRLKYTAYIVPKFTIDIVDENRTYEDGSYYSWKFYSEHGMQEMIEVLSDDSMLPKTDSKTNEFTKKGIYYLQTEGKYTELITNEKGEAEEMERTVTAELAFRYGVGYNNTFVSFVNTIRTALGGVHEQALQKAWLDVFGNKLTSTRGLLTAKDGSPTIEDFFEGITIALSVNVPEPQFKGQQKAELSGPEVRKALTKALTETFTKFVEDKKNQNILKPILQKVAQATKNRQSALEAKLAKRKSHQVSSASMPSKLSDCDLTGTEEAELLICEGDSAAGTIIKARDATYQAVLPIRGKILNSLKASMTKILSNSEIMDIAKALGAGFGKNFDIDKIRYGKVLFAADADVDGAQINNLLFTVFNRMFHQMIVEGRVYQTVPPLFEVKIGTGNNQETKYVSDESELNVLLKKLDKQKKTYKIDREKGLGEMEPEDFKNTVLDPKQRRLKRITIRDAELAEKALELTMGDNSQERRDFMEDNFQVAIDSGLVEGFEEGIE